MKYYIIKRSIIGRLLDVYGVKTKHEVNKELNELLERGYQVTVVSRTVLMTADNLEAERIVAGLPRIV